MIVFARDTEEPCPSVVSPGMGIGSFSMKCITRLAEKETILFRGQTRCLRERAFPFVCLCEITLSVPSSQFDLFWYGLQEELCNRLIDGDGCESVMCGFLLTDVCYFPGLTPPELFASGSPSSHRGRGGTIQDNS